MLNAARMSLAAILLAVYYRKHLVKLDRAALLAGSVVGVFLYLGYAFQTTGLTLTTPSKSAFLTGVSTVLGPLLLVIFCRTAFSPTHIHPCPAVGTPLPMPRFFLLTS